MTDFIIALSVVFISAGLLLLVANQFGLPTVPTYIAAGVLSGPVVAEGALLELALWGIAFLVFVFGTRVDLGALQSVLRDGEVAAITQLAVVAPIAFAVGFGLLTTFGVEDPVRNAIYFSVAATLSSTLVGGRILAEEIRTNLVYGRLASATHFFDDIVAIGVLLILSADVLTDAQLITSNIGYGVLFLLAGWVIYRHGFALLVRLADGGEELVLMGSISILIAFLAAAEAVGISIVVGAFAAGIAVRLEGVESLGVRNGVESIKDFFSAIFFVTVGALLTVPGVEVLVLAGALIGLVAIVNPLVHTATFTIEGYDGRSAFLASSSLNQVSEFTLVVAIQALLLGTITDALFEAIILAAAVTMVLSSVTNRYEHVLYDRLISPVFGDGRGRIEARSSVPAAIDDHVVVVGYGRQGRRIVETLEELSVPYIVIENDPVHSTQLERHCENFVFGDAMAAYPLELAGVSRASLIVSTTSYQPVSERLLTVETAAPIILRADGSPTARTLLDKGALFVAVPSVLASDRLVEHIERVLEDDGEREALRQDHREYLKAVELEGELVGQGALDVY